MKKTINFLMIATTLLLAVSAGYAQNSLTTDEGIKAGGLIWATRNVDKPGTFAANRNDPGKFYQWNSKIWWTPADPPVNCYGTNEWIKTEDAAMWQAANDPCPTGWRVPSYEEWSLFEKYVEAYASQYPNDMNNPIYSFGNDSKYEYVFKSWREFAEKNNGELLMGYVGSMHKKYGNGTGNYLNNVWASNKMPYGLYESWKIHKNETYSVKVSLSWTGTMRMPRGVPHVALDNYASRHGSIEAYSVRCIKKQNN